MWHWLKSFIAKASAAKDVQELLNTINKFKQHISENPDKIRRRLYARNWFG
jgi:hypothetical protein